MKKISTFAKKHDIISSLFCFTITIIAFFCAISLVHDHIEDTTLLLTVDFIVRFIIGTLCLLSLSFCFGKKMSYWLQMRNTKIAWIASIGIILYAIYHLSTCILGGKGFEYTLLVLLLLDLLQQLVTGYFEESMFRGLLLEGFLNKFGSKWWGRLLAGLISFLSFGYIHMIGMTWKEDWYRFVATGTLGLAFAAIYICSRNLVIPMILHAVYDIILHAQNYVIYKDSEAFWQVTNIINHVFLAGVFVYAWICILVLSAKEKNPSILQVNEDS